MITTKREKNLTVSLTMQFKINVHTCITNNSKIVSAGSFSTTSGASTTTVSLPPLSPMQILHSDPDDERGAGSLNLNNDETKSDDDGAGVGVVHEDVSDSVDDSGVVAGAEIILTTANNNAKNGHVSLADSLLPIIAKRRKRSPANTSLVTLACRGNCGLNCFLKDKDIIEAEFLQHCANFESPIKCPLWVGTLCADFFKNNLCRLCHVLNTQQSLSRSVMIIVFNTSTCIIILTINFLLSICLE